MEARALEFEARNATGNSRARATVRSVKKIRIGLLARERLLAETGFLSSRDRSYNLASLDGRHVGAQDFSFGQASTSERCALKSTFAQMSFARLIGP